MEEQEKIKNKLTDFFKDKIFIYALISAIIVTYFYIDYKRYGYLFYEFFIHGAQIELFIPSIIWVMYLIIERASLVYNGRKILKLALGYALWMIPISIILKIINFDIVTPIPIYFDSKPNNWGYLINGAISFTLFRTIVIYIWVAFINVVCRTFVNMYKFIFKK